MERTVQKQPLRQAPDADLAYWQAQTIQARLEALEALRAQYLRTLPDAQQRFQRVCRVVQRQRG
jgi:hypothetical protein